MEFVPATSQDGPRFAEGKKIPVARRGGQDSRPGASGGRWNKEWAPREARFPRGPTERKTQGPKTLAPVKGR